jgi:hypothetical protein
MSVGPVALCVGGGLTVFAILVGFEIALEALRMA